MFRGWYPCESRQVGGLGVVQLRRVGMLGRQAEIHDQRPGPGRLRDVAGGLAVRMHRCRDRATEMEVQQRPLGIGAFRDAPQGGDTVGIHLGIGDAFGLARGQVVCLGDPGCPLPAPPAGRPDR